MGRVSFAVKSGCLPLASCFPQRKLSPQTCGEYSLESPQMRRDEAHPVTPSTHLLGCGWNNRLHPRLIVSRPQSQTPTDSSASFCDVSGCLVCGAGDFMEAPSWGSAFPGGGGDFFLTFFNENILQSLVVRYYKFTAGMKSLSPTIFPLAWPPLSWCHKIDPVAMKLCSRCAEVAL